MKGSARGSFHERAVSGVPGLLREDLGTYVWFFHRPAGPGHKRRLAARIALSALWLAIAFAIPWLIGLASVAVANAICIAFVFVVAPVFLIVYWVGRYVTYMPPFFRYALTAFTTPRDLGNVLACYFFLLAHKGALLNDVFPTAANSPPWQWALFLADQTLAAASGGAWKDTGRALSNINPEQSWAGSVVLLGFNLLIGATIIQTFWRIFRWYHAGELMTGSLLDAVTQCHARKAMSGSYISRIGRMASIRPEVYDVPTLGQQAPSISMAMEQINRKAYKRFWPLMSDDVNFGKHAHKVLGIMHVDVEENPLWADIETTRAITIYHSSFVPTTEISGRLDLARGELSITLGGEQSVTLAPQEVLRAIDGQDHVDELILYEVQLMEIVGVRSGPIVVV